MSWFWQWEYSLQAQDVDHEIADPKTRFARDMADLHTEPQDPILSMDECAANSLLPTPHSPGDMLDCETQIPEGSRMQKTYDQVCGVIREHYGEESVA